MSWKDWKGFERLPRPIRPDTIDEMRGDIDSLERRAEGYAGILSPDRHKVKKEKFASTSEARTMKGKLKEEMEKAFSDEEKINVINHFINVYTNRGWKRPAAERRVARMLRDIGYNVEYERKDDLEEDDPEVDESEDLY